MASGPGAGPEGRVVSVDIDSEVTDRAAGLLEQNGYGDRVRVLVADAEHGVPDEGPFDAIIVTVGAWDVAPALLDQLRENGVLVLPLIMNGVTRTMGFRRQADHLTSASMEVAGFVPMRCDDDPTAAFPMRANGIERAAYKSSVREWTRYAIESAVSMILDFLVTGCRSLTSRTLVSHEQ
ncbi:hypothetical protein ACI2K4_00235 [Micromonospora sp. NPDC050397]|uniref:hypothetical protein n=1 Tax=Micromonospora sp. NPDC050397 TaxID=3364279 RepID=UPI00384E1B51